MSKDDLSVARGARALDWLKAEMAGSMGQMFRLMVRGGQDPLDPLADLVVSSYLLARRMGVSFEDLDARIHARLEANVRRGHQLERWFGDLSALDQYRREGS